MPKKQNGVCCVPWISWDTAVFMRCVLEEILGNILSNGIPSLVIHNSLRIFKLLRYLMGSMLMVFSITLEMTVLKAIGISFAGSV